MSPIFYSSSFVLIFGLVFSGLSLMGILANGVSLFFFMRLVIQVTVDKYDC